jgi:hypothetical protein
MASTSAWARYGAKGSSTWSTSIESAASQAEAWTERVAKAKAWKDATLLAAGTLIVGAADSADTALGFWRALAQRWGKHTEIEGWDKLGLTWSTAAGAATSKAAEAEANKLSTIIAGTLKGSLEDIKEGGEWWGKYGKFVIGATILMLLVVLVWKYT